MKFISLHQLSFSRKITIKEEISTSLIFFFFSMKALVSKFRVYPDVMNDNCKNCWATNCRLLHKSFPSNELMKNMFSGITSKIHAHRFWYSWTQLSLHIEGVLENRNVAEKSQRFDRLEVSRAIAINWQFTNESVPSEYSNDFSYPDHPRGNILSFFWQFNWFLDLI